MSDDIVQLRSQQGQVGLPIVKMDFPRSIRAIHQIEITSRCNLKCSYCPSPTLGRPKVDMDEDTFLTALTWAKRFVEARTQFELNLAGIGESTLHPWFTQFVWAAREILGDRVKLIVATNGIAVTEEMVAKLKGSGLQVWVSLHQPAKAAHAIPLLHNAGLLAGTSLDGVLNANDWAGQVEKPAGAAGSPIECQWIRHGKVMVMADGRVTTCCLDASGVGVIGTLGEMEKLTTQPYDLCRTCYQIIGVDGWDQQKGARR